MFLSVKEQIVEKKIPARGTGTGSAARHSARRTAPTAAPPLRPLSGGAPATCCRGEEGQVRVVVKG